MSAQDRRKYQRFDIKVELTIVAATWPDDKSREFLAYTLNISRGGMLFYSIAEFSAGKVCHMRFAPGGQTIERTGTIGRALEEPEPGLLPLHSRLYALAFSTPLSEEEFRIVALNAELPR
jgi:hypothetical protein